MKVIDKISWRQVEVMDITNNGEIYHLKSGDGTVYRRFADEIEGELFKVKYLDWSHKVKTMDIQANTEKQVEKAASNTAEVKCILSIKQANDI